MTPLEACICSTIPIRHLLRHYVRAVIESSRFIAMDCSCRDLGSSSFDYVRSCQAESGMILVTTIRLSLSLRGTIKHDIERLVQQSRETIVDTRALHDWPDLADHLPDNPCYLRFRLHAGHQDESVVRCFLWFRVFWHRILQRRRRLAGCKQSFLSHLMKCW